MKKWLSMALAGMLVCALAAASAEPFEDCFRVDDLYAYATAKDTPAFDLTLFTAADTSTFEDWEYSTYDSAMQYEFGSQDAVQGYTDLTFFFSGSGSDFGIPFLYLDGHSEQKLSIKLVQILVGDRLYWLDCKRIKDGFTVEKDGDDGYDFDLVLPLGNPGIALLNDLYAANFAFSLRVYDAKKLCFAIEQPAIEDEENDYRLFYEGLVESGLVDENGRVQDSVGVALNALNDQTFMPGISIYPYNEKLWLPEGKTSLPKTVKTIKAVEDGVWQPRTSLEYTYTGDWGRVKTVPWIKIELRNTDKKRAVEAVTFTYYCTDKSGENVCSAITGELYNEMTIEQAIRSGKKKMLPKYSLEGYGADACVVYTAIREVKYADGSVETVPDRDLNFVTWNIK